MARTLAEGLSKGMESLSGALQRRRLAQNDQLDQATKLAALQEAGYTVNQGPRSFLGVAPLTIERDPNTTSSKELQKQKLANDLEMSNYKLKNARRYFGDYGTSGDQPPSAQMSQEDFVMSPDGRFVANPNKVKPLNELQQAQLADRKRKEQEALQLKQDQEDELKNTASDELATIAEVKKGVDNFGLFGNLPSIPGTERVNWESNINKLLEQQTIKLLAKMKSQSKTGASGLGSLSEGERKMLKDASTALKRGLSKDDAMRYLNQMEIIDRKLSMGGGKRLGNSGGYQVGQIVTIKGKSFRVIGGDPNDPDVEPV